MTLYGSYTELPDPHKVGWFIASCVVEPRDPEAVAFQTYRGTSLIRNQPPIGPYSRSMPMALWRSLGGGLILVREVPL